MKRQQPTADLQPVAFSLRADVYTLTHKHSYVSSPCCVGVSRRTRGSNPTPCGAIRLAIGPRDRPWIILLRARMAEVPPPRPCGPCGFRSRSCPRQVHHPHEGHGAPCRHPGSCNRPLAGSGGPAPQTLRFQALSKRCQPSAGPLPVRSPCVIEKSPPVSWRAAYDRSLVVSKTALCTADGICRPGALGLNRGHESDSTHSCVVVQPLVRERGLEPPRPSRATATSTLRVYHSTTCAWYSATDSNRCPLRPNTRPARRVVVLPRRLAA
jgi:hypothetical protein